jgi:hypothetical protein
MLPQKSPWSPCDTVSTTRALTDSTHVGASKRIRRLLCVRFEWQAYPAGARLPNGKHPATQFSHALLGSGPGQYRNRSRARQTSLPPWRLRDRHRSRDHRQDRRDSIAPASTPPLQLSEAWVPTRKAVSNTFGLAQTIPLANQLSRGTIASKPIGQPRIFQTSLVSDKVM